ncbi:MAG TPA: hypothetical protein VE244_14575 [Nitrososphaeraceae archaeon]|jgi:hypothetical protein|nr:hypothetical protein [Nitrososphaeraceae archaeon]
MTKAPGIYPIFEKDENEHYTKNALLYQDILRYYLTINEKDSSENNYSFSLWDLGMWLLQNNSDFINLYKDLSTRNIGHTRRYNNLKDHIKKNLEHLMQLQLIQMSGTTKAAKVDTDIAIYKHTELGQILGWLIVGINPDKQANANNEIFHLLDSVLFKIKEDSPSTTIFYSHFFRKCRDRGVFDKLIQHIWYIAHTNLGITNMQDLFERVVDLGFEDEDIRRMFFDLWRESLEELGSNQKALVLYQMKLDAERRFQNKKKYFTKEYEEKHFQYRDNYENIVVEGNCEKCGTGPLALSYLEYRKRLAHVARNDSIKLDCPVCSSKDSLIIPSF